MVEGYIIVVSGILKLYFIINFFYYIFYIVCGDVWNKSCIFFRVLIL